VKVPVPEECTCSAGHISPERPPFDTVAERPTQGKPSRVELAFTPPFDADAVLGNLRAHAIAGAEVVQGDTITRLIAAPSGPVEVAVILTPDSVRATIGSTDAADVAEVTTDIRRWFDLDLDPSAVAAVLGRDPVVGPLVESRPGLRIVGSPNGFETAVMAVLGQQVSLARARALGAMLVDAYGEPGPAGLRIFPSAATLASVPLDELRATLRLTGMRALALHSLAVAGSSGLDLSPETDRAQARAELLALPGIGPWTADYLAVRVLGDRDAFTAGDLVLRRALGRVTTREAEAASQAWRPYRAYALFHLWTATSY
jgi:3-methyladenine DNA glycosylase/8-oxoguanine DNA glycosylase